MSETTPVPRIKEAHCAGRWYPADASALDQMLTQLLTDTCGARPGCLAILVPHGALEHSGRTAAYGYAAAGNRGRRRAILLAPSHHTRFQGAALLGMDGYRTPLGLVTVDTQASAMLARHPLVRVNPALFMREHAIEIQLPFLQRLLPELAIVPMLVGEIDTDARTALADVLRPLLVPENLVVVSSDLVHYGRRFDFLPVPPSDTETVRAAVRALDDGALDHVVAGDAASFERFVAETGATICGQDALGLLLAALPPGVRGERLAYATSLDVTGEYQNTVSYAAVSFTPPLA